MSFNFKWPTFSEEFHTSAAQMLNSALNRGPKPKVIADDILVEELGMGTIPPELEILEIGDLGTDRFRGIFRLTYAGDAHLVLKTKVQANPLSKPNRTDIGLFPSSNASRGILFAAAPLVVPMHLRLSSVKLRAIVVLVVSKAKGITLVFKNDPLESVEVSSTFDSVAVIQKYLQQEIEGQLREMFREDLPGIIHRLSQKWLSGEVKSEKEKAKQKAEAEESLQKQPPRTREPILTRSSSEPSAVLETASAPGGTPKRSHSKGKKSQQGRSGPSVAGSAASPSNSPPKARGNVRRPRHVAKAASTSAVLLHNELPVTHASPFDAAFPDIENYDPTYGLRPDDLPTHRGFSGLGRLAQRGLGGLKDLTASPTLGKATTSMPDRGDIDLDGAAVFEDFDRHSEDVDSEVDHEHDAHSSSQDGHRTDDDVTTDSGRDVSDDVGDDVSDLDVHEHSSLVDTSIDYTRFGYPPASAAFSDTHELNRASSIIFDDEPQSSTKRGKRGSTSGRSASGARRPSSSRSERSTTSPAQRRKPKAEVVYETIPAVGGGTVTRPRVYHIASKVQPPEVDWDDEDTARPSQYGGTPSTRTGATRFGSDYGSATMGAQSSRTNTVRGMHDSPHLGSAFVSRDSSDESLLDLPPESYHSSDASHQQAFDAGRSSVSGSDLRRGLPNAGGPVSTSRESSYRDLSSQDLQWDHSAASTAPTSSQSQNWDMRNDAAIRAANAYDGSDAQSSSGIKFRKNKSANHQRSKTMGGGDRSSFLAQRAGEGPGLAATPARHRASAAARPGFITYATSPPGDSSTWQRSPPLRASSDRDAAFSTSPGGAQDMLSISPFRDSSLHHGSPRGASNIAGAFASASNSPQTAGHSKSAQGSGAAATRLSIDASAHFLDLVKSNHTLSPFTRNMEHFTVRSAPVTPGWQTASGSASAVGSSAASGTGTTSGSSQTGAKHGKHRSNHTGPHKHGTGSAQVGSEQRAQRDADSSVPTSALPARRRRTFQLGSSSKQDDVTSASSSPSPVDYREGSPSNKNGGAGDDYGFARYAGSGPKPFKAPGSASSSSVADSTKGLRSGLKDARRRSRPDSMGPPSEAARLSALRWEAIRE
ncbi:probable Mitochondrial distribution and morphology protein 34 [Ustilago trichophora]|uniref:Mitochondrial distribution and morphology protein 34 n=1 Tax=Ustilago trichophora TaxID=86804 RepID=A0A5C3DT96_9BASI|nr:probable Mitochondrial distribution and morphology protein 34 [Ustilago trichophora]